MDMHSSKSLVFAVVDGELVGFNFLQKSGFKCSGSFLDILANFTSRTRRSDDFSHEVMEWLALGAIVDANTDLAKAEQEYAEKWEWGLPAALYHFCVQGNGFRSLEDGENRQRESLDRLGLPVLNRSNSCFADVTVLSRENLNSGLLSVMTKRRSNREPSGGPVKLDSVARLLFAGMGITAFTNNSVVQLPLKMTPSGGARNPYEAYLFARNVEGLEPGVYHYSALEHSLGKLGSTLPDNLSSIIGGQDWAKDMAGIIILAAHFERSMWKYDDPNAYRVILVEAGHIGQNMLLSATDDGLAVCPTAALDHNLIYDLLDLPSRIMCAPVYAVAFGSAGNSGAVQAI